ncbi:hypothetical protein EVAR_97443_1 [Eumeta japonica]|uniref:Uncharacterized protein n=1 Tax=Eumeta variegata TaxID=151549 RepID=A0A4C1WZ77_EUMVA|nr:hypothetical protein EVAR_97443_1 [Eumeta japonica]
MLTKPCCDGDFNGQIGERQPVEDIVLGPFIYGKKLEAKRGKACQLCTGECLENPKHNVQEERKEGKRKRGRQQKRWDDDIRKVAGITWSRVARERSEWSRLEEAFANWQTDLQKVKKHQIHNAVEDAGPRRSFGQLERLRLSTPNTVYILTVNTARFTRAPATYRRMRAGTRHATGTRVNLGFLRERPRRRPAPTPAPSQARKEEGARPAVERVRGTSQSDVP